MKPCAPRESYENQRRSSATAYGSSTAAYVPGSISFASRVLAALLVASSVTAAGSRSDTRQLVCSAQPDAPSVAASERTAASVSSWSARRPVEDASAIWVTALVK